MQVRPQQPEITIIKYANKTHRANYKTLVITHRLNFKDPVIA